MSLVGCFDAWPCPASRFEAPLETGPVRVSVLVSVPVPVLARIGGLGPVGLGSASLALLPPPLGLDPVVAGQLAEGFLDRALKLLGRSGIPVFGHGHSIVFEKTLNRF